MGGCRSERIGQMSASKVFLGVHGEVLALDRTTGQTVWRTKLTGGDFVNLLLDQDRIIATTKGEAYCVDAATGQLLWHNKLPGVGWGLMRAAREGVKAEGFVLRMVCSTLVKASKALAPL